MTETGISADHVIRHYDAKRKHCPRKMLDQPQLWTDFKNVLNQPHMQQGGTTIIMAGGTQIHSTIIQIMLADD